MKKYRVILIILVLSGTAFASAPDIEWTKAFTEMVNVNDGLQADDGGYVIVGSKLGVTLLKTDSLGNKEWDKNYSVYAYSISKTQDSCYVITGSTGVNEDLFLLKIDLSGNEIWLRTFEGGIYGAVGYCVCQTNDKGYIIAGTINPDDTSNVIWLIKTDSLGNKEWDKPYVGCGGGVPLDFQKTSDGGYIMTGGSYGIWVIKTDSLGDTLWTKVMGDGFNNMGKFGKQTRDGGYIIGSTNWYSKAPDSVRIIKLASDVGLQEGY
jgi:hypothetical protein